MIVYNRKTNDWLGNMQSKILNKMGYPDWVAENYINFFIELFECPDELENFFERIFKYDQTRSAPRRILNQIYQLISIADDIDVIRPERDPLRVLFLRSCLEAIYKLAGLTNKDVGGFFDEYISFKGKKYITDNFCLVDMEPVDTLPNEKRLLFEEKKMLEFSMCNFSWLFRSIRNDVVHDGNYYEMQLWARDEESKWLSQCESFECVIGPLWNKNEFGVVSFHFETTMMYRNFRYYFLQGCIAFLVDYINRIENE